MGRFSCAMDESIAPTDFEASGVASWSYFKRVKLNSIGNKCPILPHLSYFKAGSYKIKCFELIISEIEAQGFSASFQGSRSIINIFHRNEAMLYAWWTYYLIKATIKVIISNIMKTNTRLTQKTRLGLPKYHSSQLRISQWSIDKRREMGEKRYNREREADKHPAGFISSKSLQYLSLEVRTIFKFVWNCCLFLREKNH